MQWTGVAFGAGVEVGSGASVEQRVCRSSVRAIIVGFILYFPHKTNALERHAGYLVWFRPTTNR